MTPTISYRTGKDLPTDQLESLYRSVEWRAYTREDQLPHLTRAYNNSDHVISAWLGDQLVGLARCLSDDVSIFYLQDILVHPKQQRQGIGTKLLRDCLVRYGHVRSKVLLTGPETHLARFYESFGFKNTKNLNRTKLNVFVQVLDVDLE